LIACISINTDLHMMYDISLETVWWVLSNATLIIEICSVIPKIIANKTFTVTNGLISQLFVIAFVHPTYVWVALIGDFPVQLGLWELVHWLWRYKLNEVCNTFITMFLVPPLVSLLSLLIRDIIWTYLFTLNIILHPSEPMTLLLI